MGFENITDRVENQVGWLEYNRPPVNRSLGNVEGNASSHPKFA